jgi:hypothetical protein
MRRSYCNQQSLFFEFPSIFLKIRNGVNSKITKLVHKVHKVLQVCKVYKVEGKVKATVKVKVKVKGIFGCHSGLDPESRAVLIAPSFRRGK